MICFPNAKINIGLRVIDKRPDGYHNLETVFYPIGLKDVLEVVPSKLEDSLKLSVTGANTGDLCADVESNIVTKAYRLLEKKYALPPVSVYLHKAIPSGAGLGGGSSDAAQTLILLNTLNKLGLSVTEMEQLSAQLGADCAFFIKNNPIFAKGIGTDFEPLTLNLTGWYLVLIKPDIHVSTAEAYSLVTPRKPKQALKTLIEMPLETWKGLIVNDFEESVFDRYPAVSKLKDTLYAHGAVYASMSGSGSSVFGLFRESLDLKKAFPGCFYWSETLTK